MRQAERNPHIAAIVLYVNSPGGEVFASDLMWREVQRIRQKKPIVVAMGNTAASGGYYLSTHASAIIAQPATITGSIGVFILRPILAEALEHAAIHTTTVSRGAHSGLLGGTQPSTASEQQALQDLVFALYADFTDRVSSGRGLSAEQLEPIADGRVWLGNEALNYGLVDQLGGTPEALLKAQALAGLPANRNASMIALHSGKAALAPQPFPTHTPAEMLQLVTNLLRSTAWALLPFECW
jgi:protease-4